MTGFGRSSKAMALPSALCKLSSIGQARSAEDRSAAPDCSPACGPVLHHKFLVGARPLPLLAMGSQPELCSKLGIIRSRTSSESKNVDIVENHDLECLGVVFLPRIISSG